MFWQEKKTSIIQKDVKGKRDAERYTPYRPQRHRQVRDT